MKYDLDISASLIGQHKKVQAILTYRVHPLNLEGSFPEGIFVVGLYKNPTLSRDISWLKVFDIDGDRIVENRSLAFRSKTSEWVNNEIEFRKVAKEFRELGKSFLEEYITKDLELQNLYSEFDLNPL